MYCFVDWLDMGQYYFEISQYIASLWPYKYTMSTFMGKYEFPTLGLIATCLSLTGTELSLGNPAPIDTSDPVQPLDYTEWLQDWTRLNKPSSTDIMVPLQAQHIATPLLPLEWGHLLATHPNRKLVAFFLQGLTEGFRIGYDYTFNTLKPAKTNMESALSHTAVVEDYIAYPFKDGRSFPTR